MGIWEAAKRGEGYQLARESNVTWFIVVIASVLHFFWRFFSGRPLLGDQHRKTDAEWNVRPTRKLHQNARTPGWWSWLPERTRAGIRVGVLIVVVAVVWGLWDGTAIGSLTHNVFTAAGTVLTWMALYKVTGILHGRFTDRRHNRDLLSPFKAAVAPLLGIPQRDVKVHIPSQAVKAREGR